MIKKWFWIGMVGVFLLSVALRFWGMERFNTLVFDEVYYAKFGNNYLTHTQFFDGHPPLGKYIIAIGIWIGSHFPFGQDLVNGLTGSLRSPISYRWINALTGSFIPLIVAGIAYQISHRRSYAFIAGLFAALDGLFLVESRYALINIYLVTFGLLGQWFFLLALEKHSKRCAFWLILSGIAFGASISVKWNGLFFLAGAYLIWIAAWVIRWVQSSRFTADEEPQPHPISTRKEAYRRRRELGETPLQNLTRINVFQLLFFLGIIPVFIYCITWIPHLNIDTRYGFVEVHKRILNFHERLGGNSSKVHPYCAAWYTWPLMIRPMAYLYETAASVTDPLPVYGPPLPSGTGKVVYDVHAMGNPFLWWFSLAGIVFLVGLLLVQIVIAWLQQKRLQNAIPEPIPHQRRSVSSPLSPDTWIALYLVLNYAANLLPWARVTRCVFIYHYMGPVVFGFLAIAWFVDQCIRSYYILLRIFGITIIFIIVGAFIFWLPLYLGLPISPEGYKMRMLLQSWV